MADFLTWLLGWEYVWIKGPRGVERKRVYETPFGKHFLGKTMFGDDYQIELNDDGTTGSALYTAWKPAEKGAAG